MNSMLFADCGIDESDESSVLETTKSLSFLFTGRLSNAIALPGTDLGSATSLWFCSASLSVIQLALIALYNLTVRNHPEMPPEQRRD